MTDKSQQKVDNNKPREVPTRHDPGKIKPYQDPDLKPDKSNPINPETDEPNKPATENNHSSDIEKPVQDDPGEQISS